MTLRPNPDLSLLKVLSSVDIYRQSIWLLKRARLINTLCLLSSHSLSTTKVKSTSLTYIKHASFLCFSSREQIAHLELVITGFTCPVNGMPRLKLLRVVVRNCSLVVVLTTSVSASVAFSETFVAVSLTVALMTNLARRSNPVPPVLRPCCLESPNKRGLTEMSLQPLIYERIKERKNERKKWRQKVVEMALCNYGYNYFF